METKRALTLAGLLMVLLASLALVPPASAPDGQSENHLYIVMGGTLDASTQLGPFPPTFWVTPFQTRPPDLTPLLMEQNITFSEPWELTTGVWIVNLSVPAETYVGVSHAWYDATSGKWFKLNHYLPSGSDGYGWIFLNATGDVDCYTFNNDTGAYWNAPGDPYGFNGELAALSGYLPDPGPDGVAGTSDDGFGDGTPDPAGSSILMLPSRVHTDWWNGTAWDELFDVPWPVIFTTGTAYDIVDEPASDLDGVNATVTGEPWEFLAGLQGYGPVPYGHGYWNAYVTYVSSWSMLNVWTEDWGWLDVMFKIEEKKMREDCVLPDIKGDDEEVKIFDVRKAAKAYDTYDEGPGEDGIPGTADDRPSADALFDAAADVKDCVHVTPAGRGHVDIFDIRRIAKDYGKKLTPNGIIKP